MNKISWFWRAIVLLGGCLPSLSFAAPVWIYFDNLPANTWVTHEFEEQGVHVVSDYQPGQSYQSAPQIVAYAQAHSAPNVLVNQATDDEIFSSRNVPLVLWFDQPISGVGMQLGCVGACSGSVTATVLLFDCQGQLRASGTNSPQSNFYAPLQVLDASGTTRMVVIDYGDTSSPEAIDDLAFQPSGANCVSSSAPSVSITSHANNQVLIQPNILLQGTTMHESGIIREVTVNGNPAALTPVFNASGELFYRFRIPLVLKEGYNSVTARAVGSNGKIASHSINLSIGAPTTVQLVNFHLTQRGIMRTNDVCDVDAPLVAGKFTIVRAQFEARTASNAKSYVDGVLMSLWRRVNGSPVLVDTAWGELYSPQTVNFTSAGDLAGVHFWISADQVDQAGEYAMTFQSYVGVTPIGPPLEVPCANRWFTFAETKPVRLLILPVEGQLFDYNLLAKDHDRVFEQLDRMARLFPMRDGYSSIGSPDKTGIKFTYTMPHHVCDGITQNSFCKGTGFEWRFKDTDPSGLWRPEHESVVDTNITTCKGDSIIGGRITSSNLVNLPAATPFGLFTPGTPAQWEGRRYAWPLDDNHNGTIEDDLPHYVAEFFDLQTGQWLTNLSQYDQGETFRSYVDTNGNYCFDKNSETKLPMQRKWENVGANLLWAPAKKVFKDYNDFVGTDYAKADYVTLWFPNSFHPMNKEFHQFDPGTGLLNSPYSWITPGDYVVLGHELGHNFGLNHANNPPLAWQAYARHQRIDPSKIYSNMRAWTGPPDMAFFRDADYLSIFQKLTNRVGTSTMSPVSASESRTPMLAVDAVLDPEGGLGFLDFGLSMDLEAEAPMPDSPFRLRIGARDSIWLDLGFPIQTPVQETWSSGDSVILASLVTAWPEGAEWFEVVPPVGAPERHYRSAYAPVVELLTPNGGEGFVDSDPIWIEWQADDRDHSALTYSLFYSPDGNQWFPIAVGLTETVYVANASNLPGGMEARIRVVASDGFNESEDESDDVFSVSGKMPIVHISSPAPDSQYLQWDSIPVEGAALDPEGKSVSAAWYLDGDTQSVGSGFSLLLAPLAPGEHWVQLIIHDADGYELAAERSFTVSADSDRDGMADDYEEQEGLDPSLADDALSDPDGDGVTSFDEAWRGLHAGNPDSDGDGVDDGTELQEGSDPLDNTSYPVPPNVQLTAEPATRTPIIDGKLTWGEWDGAATFYFEQGFTAWINDRGRLYLLVNVLTDDQLDMGDACHLLVDWDHNGELTPQVDFRLSLMANAGFLELQRYLGNDEWSAPEPVAFSSVAEGFDCFPADFSMLIQDGRVVECNPHRVVEMAIDLEALDVRSGNPPQLRLAIDSDSPAFHAELPEASMHAIKNWIEIEFQDWPRPVEPIPSGDPNANISFEGQAIEVTQAIQNRQNSLPLVEDKKTVARLYLTVGNSSVPQPAQVFLHASSNGSALAGSPLTQTFTLPLSADRDDLDDTPFFLLPAGWTHGQVVFKGEVRYAGGQNSAMSNPTPVQFIPCSTPRIWTIPINTGSASSPVLPNNNQIGIQEGYLQSIYPVPAVKFTRKSWKVIGATTLNNTKDELNDYMRNVVLGWVFGLLVTGNPPFELPDQLVGFTAGNTDGGDSNPVWINNGKATVVRAAPDAFGGFDERVIAHEVTHNLDRSTNGTWGRHVGNPNPATWSSTGGTPDPNFGCGASGPNLVWPWNNDDIQEFGFDTRPPVDPDTIVDDAIPDFMSYCNSGQAPPAWISTYHWTNLLNHFRQSPSAAFASMTERMQEQITSIYQVTGWVDRDGGGHLNPVRTLPGVPHLPVREGPYSVRLLDEAGEILLEIFFDVVFEDVEGNPLARVAFDFQIPEVEGMASIELMRAGAAIAELSRTPSPPEVFIVAPEPGAYLDEPFLVEWFGDDPDGDEVTYSLFYSPDQGVHWIPVAHGIQGDGLEVDPSILPGSEEALLRLIATDGLNTTISDMEYFFAVPNKPPLPIIREPQTNARFAPGQPIRFEASATDQEEESLPDSAFVWSLGGEAFGVGRAAEAFLPLGDHEVVLTVTDGEMETATATVNFSVQPAVLQLKVVEVTDSGQLLLQVRGNAGQWFVIEESFDLQVWNRIEAGAIQATSTSLLLHSEAGPRHRFYRAVSLY